MKPLALILLALLFASCATTRPQEPFYTRIYQGNYDDVWISTLKALNDYPLKASNKDTGRIQSETVPGPYNENSFSLPEAFDLPERFHFSLVLNVARLNNDEKRPQVRVRITKELERFIDFYAGWRPYNSDGMEERLVLYRIEHLLQIEKRLNKMQASPK